MKSKGLGDTVKKIADFLGIDRLAKEYTKVTGKNCGCGKRQTILNNWLTYTGSLREWEYDYLDNFFKSYKGSALESFDQRDMLLMISNRVFNKKEAPSNCSSCLRNMINALKSEFDKYEKTGENI